VFVTGSVDGGRPTEKDITIAYDSTSGAPAWSTPYDGPGGGGYFVDAPSALSVSPDGTSLFITAVSSGPDGTYDYVTVAYRAATGAQHWVTRYTTGGDDWPNALALSPDGTRVTVTGSTSAETTSGFVSKFATVTYDAATGAQLWARKYRGAGNYTNQANAVVVSADGARTIVTGEIAPADPANGEDYGTVAYSLG
jgi:WD40 repeat protein